MSPSSPGFRRARTGRERTGAAEGLGVVLDELLATDPWRRGVRLGDLAARWSEVVGERLAQESQPGSFDRGTLTIKARSQAWAGQLRFLAEEVRTRANRALGGEMINEVRVVVSPADSP